MQGKKILLGVTGSIAAYKTAQLVRLFIKAGAEVQVIATTSALDFVTAATLATLSKKPVLSDFYKNENGEWNNHVELALWADILVIAPLSANTLGKIASGICDNLLLATYLSAKCPVYVAPAMDLDMFAHPTTQENLRKISLFGNQIIPSEKGELASGLIGEGRMAEPETIFESIYNFFNKKLPFSGKNVLITAGPTYENIDAVRFIGNYSSGKMGFALAKAFADLGAVVTLISGPSHETINNLKIKLINVVSAQEMLDSCMLHFDIADIIIMSAAVADYTPSVKHTKKLKKEETNLTISLTPTVDILKQMGLIKKDQQFLVGFALESNNEFEYAKNKLAKKNLNMVVLNSLNVEESCFGTDTNKVWLIDAVKTQELPLLSKQDVAYKIAEYISIEINS